MSLYFFHLRDGQDTLLDPEGREFATLDEVERAALKDARTLIAADAREGIVDLTYHIDVECPSGAIVHSIEFEDAVRVVRKPA